jgi:hypothetical protein
MLDICLNYNDLCLLTKGGVIPEFCNQESRGGGIYGFSLMLSKGQAYACARLLEAGKLRE